MSSDQDDQKEIEVIKKGWNKTERELTKTGLREGISEGRESSFQDSFDDGYYEGFRNGFVLGQYKGALFAINQLKSRSFIEEDPVLSQPKKALCEICKDNELLNENIQQIKERQVSVVNENLEPLYTTYSMLCGSNLPNKVGSDYLFNFK